MQLRVVGLSEFRDRLERVRAEELMRGALAAQAEQMVAAVRDALSEAPGSGEHDRPWLRTGSLRESIGSVSDGLEAVVGSSDASAAPQEMGTSRMPARPFLSPVAARLGQEVASAIGAAVADKLR